MILPGEVCDVDATGLPAVDDCDRDAGPFFCTPGLLSRSSDSGGGCCWCCEFGGRGGMRILSMILGGDGGGVGVSVDSGEPGECEPEGAALDTSTSPISMPISSCPKPHEQPF